MCEVTLSSCQDSPCHNGGQCNEISPGFECWCPDEFEGREISIVLKIFNNYDLLTKA